VGNIGIWVQTVATDWLVLQLTNSPAYLGINAAFQAVPIVIFSLVGGVIADRVPRLKLVAWLQVVQLLLDVTLAVLVGTGLVSVYHIFAYSALTMTNYGLSTPARQAMVPGLVSRHALLSAIALSGMAWHGTAVLGPSIAGLILAVFGFAANYYLNVASQVALLVSYLLIRAPQVEPARSSGTPWHSLGEGLRYAWRTAGVRAALIGIAGVSLLGRGHQPLLPVFARDVFQTGPVGLGLLLATPAVGTVLAGTWLAATGRLALARWFVLTSLALGVLVIGFASTSVFPLALVLMAGIGATASAGTTLANTVLQERVDERLRGRVTSFYMAATWASYRLGGLLGALLAEVVGVQVAVAVGGIVLLGFVAFMSRDKGLRS
jgi:MFS family permease